MTPANLKKFRWAVWLGLLGCILMGGSDWLMIYGDTSYTGALAWLTAGAAAIHPQRNALAMLLAFPAVILYAAALFGMALLVRQPRHKTVYQALTALGQTPWLCLHLFYIMILFTFGWLSTHGQAALAAPVGEAMFHQFWWLVLAGEALILLPFLYWLWLVATGHTLLPRWMAVNSPLTWYVVGKLATAVMPDAPFRLAFTNGLMSEAMVVFLLVQLWAAHRYAAR